MMGYHIIEMGSRNPSKLNTLVWHSLGGGVKACDPGFEHLWAQCFQFCFGTNWNKLHKKYSYMLQIILYM
jgi:hypothetical protein